MYFVQLLLCHESHLRKRPQVMELANIILPQHNPGCHSLLLPNSLTPLAPISWNSMCICGPNNISNTLSRALPSKHHVIWWETIACSSERLTVSQWILSGLLRYYASTSGRSDLSWPPSLPPTPALSILLTSRHKWSASGKWTTTYPERSPAPWASLRGTTSISCARDTWTL